MTDLALIVAVIFVALGLGSRLLRLFSGQFSGLGEFLFALGLGLGLIAYLILFLGLLGLLYKWSILILLVALALVSLRGLKRSLVSLFQVTKSCLKRKPDALTASLAFVLFSTGFLNLVGALAPPASVDWDGLSYHLAIPKIYLRHHRIIYIPFCSHSNFPFTVEMLYLLGLALRGETLAKLFHFFLGLSVCLLIYEFGKKYFNRYIALLAAAIFYTMPLISWESTVAYVDLGLAFYGFLALYAFSNYFSCLAPRAVLVISGVFCGLGLGVKMMGAIVLVVLFLGILYKELFIQRSKVSAALSCLRFSLPALLVASPWYIKSYLMTGNPFYPFFYHIFGGLYWSAGAAKAYRMTQLEFGLGRGVLSYLSLPWNLTFYTERFFESPRNPQPFTMLFSRLSPLFLAFIPILFFLGKVDKFIKYLLVYSGLYITLWFFLMQQVRYLIPCLPLLSICAAYAIYRLQMEILYLRSFIALLLALTFIFGISAAGLLNYGNFKVALGGQSREEYLYLHLDVYPVFDYINGELPEGAKIIFYGETRGFYCDRDYMWGDSHHEMIDYGSFKEAKDMLERFKELKLTHILINQQFFPIFAQKPTDKITQLLLESLKNGYLELVYSQGKFMLYQINYPNPE